MKYFPHVLPYFAIAIMGFIGLQESARYDRNIRSLQHTIATNEVQVEEREQVLRRDIKAQMQAYDRQVATLAKDLDMALATADELRQSLRLLRDQCAAEVVAHTETLQVHEAQLTSISTDVIATRDSIEPLRRDLREAKQQIAADLAKEQEARDQLATQYDAAFATQADLADALQDLAASSRTRATAQQRIASQMEAEANAIERLVQRAVGPTDALALDQDPSIRVAEVVSDDSIAPIAPELESVDIPSDATLETVPTEQAVPEPPQPDA